MAPKSQPANRKLEERLIALEKSVEELRKIVGDLKYELEQMTEE